MWNLHGLVWKDHETKTSFRNKDFSYSFAFFSDQATPKNIWHCAKLANGLPAGPNIPPPNERKRKSWRAPMAGITTSFSEKDHSNMGPNNERNLTAAIAIAATQRGPWMFTINKDLWPWSKCWSSWSKSGEAQSEVWFSSLAGFRCRLDVLGDCCLSRLQAVVFLQTCRLIMPWRLRSCRSRRFAIIGITSAINACRCSPAILWTSPKHETQRQYINMGLL